MKYLDKLLNERNQANKEKKNKVLGRTPKTPPRELADREVHDHGSNAETVGAKRGVKKVRGAKPDKRKTNLATIVSRTQSREGKMKRAKETIKRNLTLAHTVYHDMGYAIAEAFGLVSEGEVKRRNKQLKNKALGREDKEPDYEPGAHSSDGWKRGERKIRGQRPPRPGEPPNERGHEGRAPMRNIPKKAAMKRRGMSGPKGPLPGSKPEREDSHTVYHDMGYTIAEALGLVSETGSNRGHFIPSRDTSTIKKQSKETGHSGADLRRAGGSRVLADIAKADRERLAKRKESEEEK